MRLGQPQQLSADGQSRGGPVWRRSLSGNDTAVLVFLSPLPKTCPLMEHSWTQKSVPVPSVGVLEASAVASAQTGWAGRGFAFLAC